MQTLFRRLDIIFLQIGLQKNPVLSPSYCLNSNLSTLTIGTPIAHRISEYGHGPPSSWTQIAVSRDTYAPSFLIKTRCFLIRLDLELLERHGLKSTLSYLINQTPGGSLVRIYYAHIRAYCSLSTNENFYLGSESLREQL